jgi:hypothetical protein
MRILAFSDLHGEPSLIEKVKISAGDCDLALCCGDITPVHGSTIDAARQIGKLNTRVLAVPGNFELPNEMRTVCKELGWTDLHGKIFLIDNIAFAGCGGGNIGPFNTPYELREEEFKELLDKLDAPGKFVLVTHCPPKGSVDQTRQNVHVGSEAIRRFVEENRPSLHFCGHIHESGGMEAVVGSTKIINVARHVKVLEI